MVFNLSLLYIKLKLKWILSLKLVEKGIKLVISNFVIQAFTIYYLFFFLAVVVSFLSLSYFDFFDHGFQFAEEFSCWYVSIINDDIAICYLLQLSPTKPTHQHDTGTYEARKETPDTIWILTRQHPNNLKKSYN